MRQLDRRKLIAAACALSLPACADRRPASRPVWVVLRPSGEGHTVLVDDEEVPLAEVDAVVLAHALAANPSLDEANARQRVGVYLRADGDVEYHAVVDVMQRIRFKRLGFVAEDRRG